MATLDDDLAKAVTEGFRQAQIDIVNQDLILSGTGDVTVTLADGSKKTGPSWAKLTAAAMAAGTSAAAAEASAKNAKTSETNANSSKNAAATSERNARTSETNTGTSEINAKTSETNAKKSETNSAASASSAASSLAAAQQLTSVPFEAAPFPDVWAPLNDDLRLLAGFAPYDTLTISGQVLELPSKSLTFSRATTATYIDKSGVLRTAAINEPRFEKEGLLVEGSATNTYLQSEDPTKWTGFDTRQTLAVLNDGDTKAVTAKVTTTESSPGAFYVYNSNGIQLVAGEYCTLSVRVKGTFGRCELRIRVSSSTFANVYMDFATGEIVTPPSLPELTATSKQGADGYSYLTASLKITKDGVYSGSIVVASALSGAFAPVGTDFYFQTVQFESNPQATSYIPTAGAATTRAADDCTLQRSGNDNWWGPITFSLELHCNGLTTSGVSTNDRRGILAFYPSGGEYAVMMLDATTTQAGKLAFAYGNATFNFCPVRIDDGKVHQVVSVSDTIKNQSIVDGGNFSNPTATNKQIQGAVSSANTVIYLGRGAGSATAGQRMLNGHIRNLRIWHRALTDNQIKGLR